jgi:hypothetical protein
VTITLNLPNPLYTGTAVTMTVTFTNPGSPDPVDPTTVSFDYKMGGVWTSLSYADSQITRVSEGVYTAEIPVTAPAQTTVVAIGTGACMVTEVGYFVALNPPAPPS